MPLDKKAPEPSDSIGIFNIDTPYEVPGHYECKNKAVLTTHRSDGGTDFSCVDVAKPSIGPE
jgi:hypothetical protein